MRSDGGSERPHRDAASWERHYVEGDVPWDSGEPDRHLARVIERHGVGPGRTLEVGCGTGTNAVWMAQRGFDVSAIDLSETAVAAARARAEGAGVGDRCHVRVGDFLEDSVPGPLFDFVYDRGVFHVLDEAADRTRFAARVADALRPGGLWHSLIGSTDGPPRDSGPPRLSAREVVAAVEPRFEILELVSTRFDADRHEEARAWILVAGRRDGPA